MSAKSIWDCRADCQRSAGLIGMPNYRGHIENAELYARQQDNVDFIARFSDFMALSCGISSVTRHHSCV